MNDTEFSFECKVCWMGCSVDKDEEGNPFNFLEYNDFVVICPSCGSRIRVNVETVVLEIHHNNEIK